MRPLVRLGEARQKTRGGDGATCAANADVGNVSEVAFKQGVVFIAHRQVPCRIVGGDTSAHQFGRQLVIIGEDAGGDMAQGNDHCTRQCRRIHHDCRLEALRIGERITQDQAALGVGIEDFNGVARHRFDDIARPRCVPTRHVFTGWHQHHNIEREFHHADSFHCAQH